MPQAFALGQNVPNPFNPSTTIYYDVPAGGGNVSLRIYDVSGRLVRVLVDGHQAEGSRSVTWDGTGDRGTSLASGVYFYRMSAPGFDDTKKMVLLR
jgi:flagellar hook assembly protein FlgD